MQDQVAQCGRYTFLRGLLSKACARYPGSIKNDGLRADCGQRRHPYWMRLVSRDVWQALWRIRFVRIHPKMFFEVNLRGCNGD
jgi:hypothetical protein